jgi:glycogen debranching enzyme
MTLLKTKTSKKNLCNAEIVEIKHQAIHSLKSLVKPYGIYASNSCNKDGGYHHFFGRDSAITAMLILEAEAVTGEYELSQAALQGLLAISEFQGTQDNNFTGEEDGKIPHEVNVNLAHSAMHRLKRIDNQSKSWYIDPKDGCLKNWDSADGTPLWTLAVCKFLANGWEISPITTDRLAKAAKWIINNIERFDGFIGWIPAAEQPHRKYGGLQNQSWKDSKSPYVYPDGSIAEYPMHDIFSSAVAWAALKYVALIFKKSDPALSKDAASVAKKLKKNFNKTRGGFRNPKNHYFADALDANLKQLKTPSIDVGMCFAADFKGEVIIGHSYIHHVVNRLISDEFLNDKLGMRTYSKYIKNYQTDDQYHRGPETYWPFTAFLTARGLERQGYKIAAEKISKATLAGLSNFSSFVELYLKNGDKVELWHNFATNQASTTVQAWTAAGAYYAANYLLSQQLAVKPAKSHFARRVRNLRPTLSMLPSLR